MHTRLKCTRTLPPGYRQVWSLDMRQTGKLIIANVAGIVTLLLSAAATFAIAGKLRPELKSPLDGSASVLLQLLLVVLSIVVMLVLHEGLHGLSFWIFTRTRPRFAVKVFYAYAAVPEWYLTKWPYFITAMAPFVGITLLGFLALAIAPPWSILPLMAVIIFNASGAVGDLWVAIALLFRSPAVLANDNGDAISFYEPAEGAFLDGGGQS